MDRDFIKKDINNFKEKAFGPIKKQYHCSWFVARLIARITKNDSWYRYKTFKYLEYYMKKRTNIFCKLYYYRKYRKYAQIINVQLCCKSIGKNFYFCHGDIVINSNAIIGDDVCLIGNNCIGGEILLLHELMIMY